MVDLKKTGFSRTKSMELTLWDEFILEISPPPEWNQMENLEEVKQNVEAALRLIKNQPVLILAHIPDFPQSDDARKYYLEHFSHTKAIAMVGKSFIKNIIGNLLLTTFSPAKNTKIKIFNTREEGLNWLLKQNQLMLSA